MTLAFAPPPEFVGKFGGYRSPLLFEDGRRVGRAEQWQARRREILAEWTRLMGPWPAVIASPQVAVLRSKKADGHTVHTTHMEYARGLIQEAALLVPDGRGPFPAVLVAFYEPQTSLGLNPSNPTCDFGSQLARRGFVTLSIGAPGGDARKPELAGARCQPLSHLACVAANCWHALASLPYVDRSRIGVIGHSYGGKWSMFAGALWDRFACVVTSDPGIMFDESRPNINYWEPWYLGLDAALTRKPGPITSDSPRTGAYRRMIEEGRDLHEIHALIAPRPFLVSGGSEDTPSRWTALNHRIEIDRLLHVHDHVAMTNRPDHRPTPDSNADIYAFFERFLTP
ncbi:MAG TPA: prolyl oligopeptidase family serine peptidase [Chthonomonadaceae bacterium]|nr:prolyl oligopeptidase family serine peptidase [Chthonomonadaceae bacterium]